MSALKTQIKNLKSQTVDYDFLVDFYSVYCSYYNTSNLEDFSRLQVLSIPLANSFLSRSNNRFSYEGGEDVFEDLFSYCYSMLITDLKSRRLNFPDVKQLYAYFDKRLVLGIQSFYVTEFCKKTISLEEVEKELVQGEFELDSNSFGLLSSYINLFCSYHENPEVLFKLASFMVEALLDSSTFKSRAVNKYLLSLKLDPKVSSIVLLKLKAFSIARCALIFTLDQELDPHQHLESKGNTHMLDSQFLYVMALEDKYPGIMELYHTLGSENMKKVFLLLEGRQITFPRIKDFNKTQVYIESFMDLVNGLSLDEISKKTNMSPENLKYNLKRRFSSIQNLEHIFGILPENVKGIFENE